jgi:hypothetical protein
MIKMLLTIDNKLKLLAGLPIEIKDFGRVKPLTLREVIDKGYSNYLNLLNILCVTKEHFIKQSTNELKMFDMFFLFADDDVRAWLLNALEFFLQEKVKILEKDQMILVGNEVKDYKLITRSNFEQIAKTIQMQNYIGIVEENAETIIKNDKAKQVKEKLNKSKSQIEKIKKKEDGDLESDFYDVISSISSKSSGMNKLNVFDLTIFQIYDEYKRLIHIDQYNTGISAMLQGAKNVKLQHWSSKIK